MKKSAGGCGNICLADKLKEDKDLKIEVTKRRSAESHRKLGWAWDWVAW